MRKALAAFLGVFLVLGTAFAYFHSIFLGVSDDVTVTRNTLYGDPAAAEGVDLLVRNQFGHKLLWETQLTLTEGAQPETVFTFRNESIRVEREHRYTGVIIQSSGDIFQFLGKTIPEYAKTKYAALVEALSKEVDTVPEGTSKTFQFDFAKYLEYYPLEGQIDLPGYQTVFSEIQPWLQDSELLAHKFNDFFKIPVSGEFAAEFDIDKTGTGSTYGAQARMDYFPHFNGTVTENCCYFTFDAVTDQGVVVDTSHIPGGYGIYSLPYQGNQLDFDNLKMVYALDPTQRYDGMSLSRDGKRIRLLTWQGDDLMLTVIDIATMKQIQRVKVLTSAEEIYHDVIPYDNFYLILEDRYHSEEDGIVVWEEHPDGTFGCAITSDVGYNIFEEGQKLDLFSRYDNAVDYKDGKLVVIKNRLVEDEQFYRNANYCDIYVAVYDDSGMIYAGTCEWNLTQVNGLFYNNARIRPDTEAALDVQW